MLNVIFTAAMMLAQAEPFAVGPPGVVSTPAPAKAAAEPAKGPGNSVSSVTVTGAKKATNEESRIVCHREIVLGTLFPKEVCASKSELAQRQREDRRDLERWTALKPYQIDSGAMPGLVLGKP